MKLINLSVKKHVFTEKYSPTFGKYDFVTSYDFESSESVNELINTTTRYVHSFYTYENNQRSEKSFNGATSIFVDFDGKGTHRDSSIAEFLDSDFAKKYNFVLYTSKSHTSEANCYHIMLPLKTPISDVFSLKATYVSIFKELHSEGLKCDTQVQDGARVIFPSYNQDKSEEEFVNNFVCEHHIDGVYYQGVTASFDDLEVMKKRKKPKKKKAEKEEKVYESRADEDYDVLLDDNIYIEPYLGMRIERKYKYINTVVRQMNAFNRLHKFTKLSYTQWIACGYYLRKAFGYTNGLKLFQLLSEGHTKDTPESIERQYDRLDSSVVDEVEAYDVFVRLSTTFGYSHKMFFRFYYMSRQRFDATKKFVLMGQIKAKLAKSFGLDIGASGAKFYFYDSGRLQRTFLMVIPNVGHYKVSLSTIIDIFAELLKINRVFVTTTLTRELFRREVSKNGVYNIKSHICNRVIDEVLNGNEIVSYQDINSVVNDVRSYCPSTIQDKITTRNIITMLSDTQYLTSKVKRRFGSSVTTGYSVNTSNVNKTFKFNAVVVEDKVIDFNVCNIQYNNNLDVDFDDSSDCLLYDYIDVFEPPKFNLIC